jgi:hypothetical protein
MVRSSVRKRIARASAGAGVQCLHLKNRVSGHEFLLRLPIGWVSSKRHDPWLGDKFDLTSDPGPERKGVPRPPSTYRILSSYRSPFTTPVHPRNGNLESVPGAAIWSLAWIRQATARAVSRVSEPASTVKPNPCPSAACRAWWARNPSMVRSIHRASASSQIGSGVSRKADTGGVGNARDTEAEWTI